jgi:G patch domain/KOW motif-containing protein
LTEKQTQIKYFGMNESKTDVMEPITEKKIEIQTDKNSLKYDQELNKNSTAIKQINNEKNEKDKINEEAVNKENNKNNIQNWLRNGIKVRVISKNAFENSKNNNNNKLKNFYCDEKVEKNNGVVLDVFSLGFCSVKLDNGKVLESVKEKYLETILPKIGGQCIILTGKHKGDTAILLEKKRDVEKAVVQLMDDVYFIFIYSCTPTYII